MKIFDVEWSELTRANKDWFYWIMVSVCVWSQILGVFHIAERQISSAVSIYTLSLMMIILFLTGSAADIVHARTLKAMQADISTMESLNNSMKDLDGQITKKLRELGRGAYAGGGATTDDEDPKYPEEEELLN